MLLTPALQGLPRGDDRGVIRERGHRRALARWRGGKPTRRQPLTTASPW
jgi:hypothetical protein